MNWFNLEIDTGVMHTAVRLGVATDANGRQTVVDVNERVLAGPFLASTRVSLTDTNHFQDDGVVYVPHRSGFGSYRIRDGRWPHIEIRGDRMDEPPGVFIMKIAEIEAALGGSIRFEADE